jgi:hypothetical protein
MILLLELLQIFESAIPPTVARYMRDNHIKYKASTLEELKREHAKALLRTPNPDSYEQGLSRMLGMDKLSKDELQKMAGATTQSKATSNWTFSAHDKRMGGTVIHSDDYFIIGDDAGVEVHVDDPSKDAEHFWDIDEAIDWIKSKKMDLPPADMIKQFKVEIDKKKAAHT